MAKRAKNTGTHAVGEMLTAHLLAMLKGWSAYGYDLAQRLDEAGLGEYNKGTIYRTLRQMEAMGLVSSIWDTSLGGPARRMYSLTTAGSVFLQNWLSVLDAHKTMIESLLAAPATQPRAEEAVKSTSRRTPRKKAPVSKNRVAKKKGN